MPSTISWINVLVLFAHFQNFLQTCDNGDCVPYRSLVEIGLNTASISILFAIPSPAALHSFISLFYSYSLPPLASPAHTKKKTNIFIAASWRMSLQRRPGGAASWDAVPAGDKAQTKGGRQNRGANIKSFPEVFTWIYRHRASAALLVGFVPFSTSPLTKRKLLQICRLYSSFVAFPPASAFVLRLTRL